MQSNALWRGGREVYVAEKYMAELNLCHHRIRAQSSMSAQQSHYFGIYARLNNNNNNNNTMGMASSNMQPDAKGITRGTVHDIPYLVEHDWPSTHNHT